MRQLLALLLLLLAAACQAPPSASIHDARVEAAAADRAVDQAGPDLGNICKAELIGRPCQSPAGCPDHHVCVTTSPGVGFCSCACQPDDPSTPLRNEDACPEQPGLRCGTLGPAGSFCLRTCTPRQGSSECPAPLACLPASGEAVGLPGQPVCAFAGCRSGWDCPVITDLPCGTPALPCPPGQRCQPQPDGVARCLLAGACELSSGLCRAHAHGSPGAKIGDPCRSDLDCAGSMECLRPRHLALLGAGPGSACQADQECCGGLCQSGSCRRPCPVLYRNGYCATLACRFAATLPDRACPAGSTCNRYHGTGVCQRVCNPLQAAECRGHPADLLGDYECRDWSSLRLDGEPVALDAVCDFGPLIACDTLKSSGLACHVFGVSSLSRTNVTEMRCRTLDGTATLDPFDPGGFCLDRTASGPAR